MLTAIFSVVLVFGCSFFGVCCGALLAREEPRAKARNVFWAWVLSMMFGLSAILIAGNSV